jgi:hypothetical protein
MRTRPSRRGAGRGEDVHLSTNRARPRAEGRALKRAGAGALKRAMHQSVDPSAAIATGEAHRSGPAERHSPLSARRSPADPGQEPIPVRHPIGPCPRDRRCRERCSRTASKSGDRNELCAETPTPEIDACPRSDPRSDPRSWSAIFRSSAPMLAIPMLAMHRLGRRSRPAKSGHQFQPGIQSTRARPVVVAGASAPRPYSRASIATSCVSRRHPQDRCLSAIWPAILVAPSALDRRTTISVDAIAACSNPVSPMLVMHRLGAESIGPRDRGDCDASDCDASQASDRFRRSRDRRRNRRSGPTSKSPADNE